MKKILAFAFLIVVLLGCSSDSDSGNNNNNNGNNVDYEFTITVDGETHKIKGNTANGYAPYGTLQTTTIDNACYAEVNPNSGSVLVYLKIGDTTESNYVLGSQGLNLILTFTSLALGVSEATITDYSYNYTGFLPGNTSTLFQTSSGSLVSSEINKLNFNITDLGSPSIGQFPWREDYNFGNTLKGNYNGVVYIRDNNTNSFTVPVQLSIDFKAIRFY